MSTNLRGGLGAARHILLLIGCLLVAAGILTLAGHVGVALAATGHVVSYTDLSAWFKNLPNSAFQTITLTGAQQVAYKQHLAVTLTDAQYQIYTSVAAQTNGGSGGGGVSSVIGSILGWADGENELKTAGKFLVVNMFTWLADALIPSWLKQGGVDLIQWFVSLPNLAANGSALTTKNPSTLSLWGGGTTYGPVNSFETYISYISYPMIFFGTFHGSAKAAVGIGGQSQTLGEPIMRGLGAVITILLWPTIFADAITLVNAITGSILNYNVVSSGVSKSALLLFGGALATGTSGILVAGLVIVGVIIVVFDVILKLVIIALFIFAYCAAPLVIAGSTLPGLSAIGKIGSAFVGILCAIPIGWAIVFTLGGVMTDVATSLFANPIANGSSIPVAFFLSFIFYALSAAWPIIALKHVKHHAAMYGISTGQLRRQSASGGGPGGEPSEGTLSARYEKAKAALWAGGRRLGDAIGSAGAAVGMPEVGLAGGTWRATKHAVTNARQESGLSASIKTGAKSALTDLTTFGGGLAGGTVAAGASALTTAHGTATALKKENREAARDSFIGRTVRSVTTAGKTAADAVNEDGFTKAVVAGRAAGAQVLHPQNGPGGSTTTDMPPTNANGPNGGAPGGSGPDAPPAPGSDGLDPAAAPHSLGPDGATAPHAPDGAAAPGGAGPNGAAAPHGSGPNGAAATPSAGASSPANDPVGGRAASEGPQKLTHARIRSAARRSAKPYTNGYLQTPSAMTDPDHFVSLLNPRGPYADDPELRNQMHALERDAPNKPPANRPDNTPKPPPAIPDFATPTTPHGDARSHYAAGAQPALSYYGHDADPSRGEDENYTVDGEALTRFTVATSPSGPAYQENLRRYLQQQPPPTWMVGVSSEADRTADLRDALQTPHGKEAATAAYTRIQAAVKANPSDHV